MPAIRFLLISLGFLFFAAGALGAVLPVLPTTPFVLLSAACFSGSPRLRARVLRIGFFREYYESYRTKRRLSRKTVGVSLAYLWGMLLLSMLLTRRLWLALLLAAIGAAVTVHILWLAKGRRNAEADV